MNSRTKNLLVILAIVVAFILCYMFAFSNTLALKGEYEKLSEEQRLYDNAPEQLAVLLKKQVYYDSILQKMNLGDTSIQNNLLRVLNIEAEKHKLKVVDFNTPHKAEINGNQLNTFDLKLEGNFTDLLKTIHTIEQKNSFGEVVHLHFQKNRNYRTRKDFLTARVFIQNIE